MKELSGRNTRMSFGYPEVEIKSGQMIVAVSDMPRLIGGLEKPGVFGQELTSFWLYFEFADRS